MYYSLEKDCVPEEGGNIGHATNKLVRRYFTSPPDTASIGVSPSFSDLVPALDQRVGDHPRCPDRAGPVYQRAPGQVTASLVNCERVAVKLTIGSSQKTPVNCTMMHFDIFLFGSFYVFANIS